MATFPCICPPKTTGERHPEGDRVKLRQKLDFRSGLAARNTVIILKQEDSEATTADILAALTEVYIINGVESWTLTDAKGGPLPISRQSLRDFMAEHPEEAAIVGEEADGLYSAAVINPLVKRAQTYSPPTPITASTSATSGPSVKRPTPSKRSSITTSPTAGTERMSASQGGGFSS